MTATEWNEHPNDHAKAVLLPLTRMMMLPLVLARQGVDECW